MELKFEFPVRKMTYKKTNEKELKLFIFDPIIKEANMPAVIFLHGGGFSKSEWTYTQFQYHAHYFSTMGMVAICVEYRTAYDESFTPIHSIQDAKSAIRWARQNCVDLQIDPNKISVCGGSSGGYMALCCAMIDEFNDQGDDISIDGRPNALVLYNPGVDFAPLTRVYPQLKEIAKAISPLYQIKEELPPSIFLHGTEDKNININQIEHFCNLMEESGNQADLIAFEGMGHGFFNYEAQNHSLFTLTNEYIEKFYKQLNYID